MPLYDIAYAKVSIFGFGIPTAQALVWEASNLMNGVEMGSTLGNFGFQAAYSAGYGPFQGQLGLGSVFFGFIAPYRGMQP